MRLPFGRHRGQELEVLPLEYLRWLAGVVQAPRLRAAVRAELERREPSPAAARQALAVAALGLAAASRGRAEGRDRLSDPMGPRGEKGCRVTREAALLELGALARGLPAGTTAERAAKAGERLAAHEHAGELRSLLLELALERLVEAAGGGR